MIKINTYKNVLKIQMNSKRCDHIKRILLWRDQKKKIKYAKTKTSEN